MHLSLLLVDLFLHQLPLLQKLFSFLLYVVCLDHLLLNFIHQLMSLILLNLHDSVYVFLLIDDLHSFVIGFFLQFLLPFFLNPVQVFFLMMKFFYHFHLAFLHFSFVVFSYHFPLIFSFFLSFFLLFHFLLLDFSQFPFSFFSLFLLSKVLLFLSLLNH